MRIGRMINAAIGATKDRYYVTRGARKNLTGIDLRYYKSLKQETGASVHNPIKVIKNWQKAYHKNIAQLKILENLNKPFEHPSTISKIFHRLTNK